MRAFFAVLLLAGCVTERAVDVSCVEGVHDEIVRVVDGDTLDGAACGRIRLALVDTPERGEPGHEEASAFARGVCPVGSRMVVDLDAGQPVDSTGTRRVAAVTCGGTILNAALVDEGHAVILTRFCGVSEFANASWARPACAAEGRAP